VARNESGFTAGADGDSIASAILNALNHHDRRVRARVIEEAARAADPDLLVRAVADHRDAVRRNAAMDALVRGGVRSVPALVRALDDPDPEVVMFAASVLGKTRDREAVPHLLRLLRYEDVNIVQAAIESLGHLRAQAAVTPLIELLDRDPWLRYGAVHALGEIGDARAADPLGAVLADDEVWEMAIAALGKVRSVRAIGHLADALRSRATTPAFRAPLRALGDALRRQPAADRLSRLPSWAELAAAEPVHIRLHEVLDGLAERESSPDELELAEAAAMLVRGLHLAPLYASVVRSARSAALRPILQFWTLAIGPDAADALIAGLSDDNPGVRALACRCAGALRLQELSKPLIARLADDEASVREPAVRALAQLGAADALPALAERLLDPEPAVCAAAQEALGTCDPAAASEALLVFPRRDPAVAAAMLRVMRASPHPNQLPFLFDCIAHDDPDVRRLAVEAMAEQPDADLIEILGRLLDDPDAEVRTTTVHLLGRKRTARARDLLLERLERLERGASDVGLIVHTLVEMQGLAVASRLIELYEQHPGVALAPVLEALAELHEPAVEPLLVALLADHDRELRCLAIKALAQFASPVAIRHILAAATDPAWQVRAAVAEALGGISGAAAAAELERLALDEHAVVATTARHRLEVAHAD